MKLLNWINHLMSFYRFGIAGGDEGGDTGVIDRGDDFTPSDDDADEQAADKAAKKFEEDLAKDKKGAKTAAEESDDASDDDGENEDEEKANDAAKGKAKKDTRIPLSRHKELLEKERAQRQRLQAELDKMHAGKEVQATNERITEAEKKLLGLEAEYAELVTGDDPKKAAAKMAEIRRLDRDIADSKAALPSSA
jgi:hypothetical protein